MVREAKKITLPLALDAMGGDNAPECVVEGAALARVRHPGLKFIFFGDREQLEPLIAKHASLQTISTIEHTSECVAMDEKPSIALRQGKNTSMRLAIDTVKSKQAFGVVSAGNTGALMAMSKIVLRMLPGISRPAIVSLFPTLRGECVILDLGANVESTANDLFNFAIMGEAFARAVLGINRPRIGILNIGSEDMKGHESLQEASQLIKDFAGDMHFHGFIEGNHIAEGVVDVVVTDGFTGNVALKMAEGTGKLIRTYLKNAFNSSPLSKLAAFIGFSAINTLKDKLDGRRRNGAMFVGLNGIAVKSHGRADAFAFCNAISVAVELAAHNINEKIIDEVQRYGEKVPAAKASVAPEKTTA